MDHALWVFIIVFSVLSAIVLGYELGYEWGIDKGTQTIQNQAIERNLGHIEIIQNKRNFVWNYDKEKTDDATD